jgi:hypothetical protein
MLRTAVQASPRVLAKITRRWLPGSEVSAARNSTMIRSVRSASARSAGVEGDLVEYAASHLLTPCVADSNSRLLVSMRNVC